MSQKKSSDLRRSVSSSNIPQLRNSRLPIRESNQKLLVRNRLGSDNVRSLDRNARPSTSRSSSSTSRPIGRQVSSSLLRPSGVTPLNRGGDIFGSKSPKSSIRKEYRPISDKNWQYEQLVKVRNYIAEKFPDFNYNNIKSGISLEFFIELAHNLFQLIDSRINISRENYISEVAANLKRYQYPVSIKPSLLKTVNTPHCWPSVLAMFAWLVDFIKEIDVEEEWTDSFHDLVDKAAIESFCHWNSGLPKSDGDQILTKLEEDLARIFEVNKEDLVNFDQRMTEFQENTREKNLKIKNLAEEVDSMQSNTDVLNERCDNYLKQKDEYEQELNKKLVEFLEKVKLIDQELSVISNIEENLQKLIAAQPHSHVEKVQITEQIKALQNTQILKEEKVKQQRELLDSCDYRLMKLKQEIETGAYKYNGIIDELELINADFRRLHIRDTGFSDANVKQEFEQVNGVIEKYLSHLTGKHSTMQSELNELMGRNEQLKGEISLAKTTVDQLSATEMELDLNIKQETKALNLEINDMMKALVTQQAKLEEVKKEKLFTLTSLENVVKIKQTKLDNLKKLKEDRNKEAVVFFQNLSKTTNATLATYLQEMRRIAEAISVMQKKQIESKKKVLKRLKQIN